MDFMSKYKNYQDSQYSCGTEQKVSEKDVFNWSNEMKELSARNEAS